MEVNAEAPLESLEPESAAPTHDDSTPPTPPKGRTGWKTWLGAAVGTAVIVAVGAVALGHRGGSSNAGTVPASNQTGAASAAGGGFPRGGRGTRGEVTKINGSKLTIRSTDPQSGATSTVIAETTSDTKVTESVEGALADLKTGDTVIVMGDESSGSLTASSITAGDMPFGSTNGQPPQGFQPPSGNGAGGNAPVPPSNGQRPGGFTAGQITSVNGSTITMKGQDGNAVTVATTPQTTVRVTRTRAVSDIKVGDTLVATGETAKGVLKASAIRIGDLGFGGRGGAGFPGAPAGQTGTA